MDSTNQRANQRVLVKAVSRSFALSLLWLPKPERHSVSLTYLLARYADTIADSGSWTSKERVSHLELWEKSILEKNFSNWNFQNSLESFGEKEVSLLREGKEILKAFAASNRVDQALASDLLTTLIGGMKWDLKTFADANAEAPIYGAQDFETFDKYTFMVAGCVGAYWAQTFGLDGDLEAIAYGKALQRINILRDVKEDWQRGRVYLPKSWLKKFDCDSGEPWRATRWKDFCGDYILETRNHLKKGADFCDRIAKSEFRLRFASVMPLLIGEETLKKLESAISWEERLKISRPHVRRLAILALMKSAFRRNISGAARSQK